MSGVNKASLNTLSWLSQWRIFYNGLKGEAALEGLRD